MRLLGTCIAAIIAGPAAAHVGHLGGLAGHDHWVAGAAVGVAAAITLWAALKGKKSKEGDDAEAVEEDTEAEDAEKASA